MWPSHVEWWIGRARRYDKSPPITCKDKKGRTYELGPGWNAWWLAIQPGWRGSEWPLSKDIPADSGDDIWATLHRAGRNGIFLVIITLAWWLAVSVEAADALDDLKRAVDDVEWVLSHSVTSSKRAGESVSGPVNKRRRK